MTPAIDTIIRILTAVAPLEISEPGSEEHVGLFKCPTCDGEGDLASDQVAEFLGSPTSFPIGMVGIQLFGIGDGHGELSNALRDLPRELERLRAESIPAADVQEFQDDVRSLLLKLLADRHIRADIDGGGCDSGDWRDFTLSEIRQAFNAIADHYYEEREARP